MNLIDPFIYSAFMSEERSFYYIQGSTQNVKGNLEFTISISLYQFICESFLYIEKNMYKK
jgi:hypothetical protein